MQLSPMGPDGGKPSRSAAALVGLLSLGFVFSPPCTRQPSAPPVIAPAPPNRATLDAGTAPSLAAADAGTVHEDESGVILGQLLAGDPQDARVTLAGSGVWPPRIVEVSATGEFRFSEVPMGIYSVSARAGSQVAEPREGLWLPAGGRIYLALRLQPGATLTGRVVRRADGGPVPEAELRVSADPLALAPRHARTDAQGRFRIEGLLPGTQRLSVSARSFVPQTGVEVRPGRPITLALVATARVSGVVYDALDHPVAGARVEVLAHGGAGLGAVLGGSSAPFARNAAGLGTTQGPVPRIPLLAPGDLLRHPSQEAPSASPWVVGSGPSALTDARGRFIVEGVPPGTVTLLATHEAHAPGTLSPLRLRPGQALTDQALVLPDGSLLHGRVVDSRGFPAADVPLLLQSEREPLPRLAMSSRDGSFAFEHVLGVLSLTATPPHMPPRRERIEAGESGDVEVTLTLEDAYMTLDGRVVDDAGFPQPNAQVELRSLRYQAPTTSVAVTEDDGSFRFSGLPAPPWTLTASRAGTLSAQVNVESPPSAAVELVLREAGELKVVVRSAFDDALLGGATVTVEQPGLSLVGQADGAAGHFVVRGVDQGPLTLHVEAPSHLPLERVLRMQVHPGSPLQLDVGELRLAMGGSLEGTISDRHGSPVPGATLLLNGAPLPSTLSDVEGHFRLSGLTPDTYHVGARHPQAGEATRPGAVTVYANQTTPGIDLSLPDALGEASVDDDATQFSSGVAMRVATEAGQVHITAVANASRAAGAGLRVGDILLSVDGVRVRFAAEARSALRGVPGEETVLRVRRGTRTRRVVVARERYSLP